jgi:hypothetical protein
MNRLKNMRCYLAGAIEKDSYGGMAWRAKVKQDLRDLSIHWLDPCDKPTTAGIENSDTGKTLKIKRADLDGAGVRALVKPIRHVDLRMVDVSDFIIARIEPDVPTFGTHEEVYRAIDQNKPTLILVEGGLDKTPLWWFDKVDLSLLFGCWADLYAYLELVAKSPVSDLSIMEASNWQWIFFNWMGEI